MDLSPNDQFLAAKFAEATRHDGWTPERKARFLLLLAENGNVRLAARRCGLSRQSAYVQQRRDPVFARAWAATAVLARDHAEQVLADRALDGIEEEVWYRGELMGTRRRHDSRLLLAHLGRLDKQAEAKGAAEAAEHFDELVALVAGIEVPEALAGGKDVLPLPRAVLVEQAVEAAVEETLEALPDRLSLVRRKAAVRAAGDTARAGVMARWDAWQDAVCAAVDALTQPEEPAAQDSVNVSTSLQLDPPGDGEDSMLAARANIVQALAARAAHPDPATPASSRT